MFSIKHYIESYVKHRTKLFNKYTIMCLHLILFALIVDLLVSLIIYFIFDIKGSYPYLLHKLQNAFMRMHIGYSSRGENEEVPKKETQIR